MTSMLDASLKGTKHWTSTYNQSFDQKGSSPSPEPRASKAPSRLSESPVGKGRYKPRDLGVFVLPGKSCELEEMGMEVEVGRVRRSKTPAKRILRSLQTNDIDGARPKVIFPRISFPSHPLSSLQSFRDSPDPSRLPKATNPLAGLGLMEQLQEPKRPVPAPRQRYRVVQGRGRRLQFCGTLEVTAKVGDFRNSSL